MELLHVQYGYDDQSVVVVNDTYQERKGMKVRARVYSLDAKLLADKEESVDVAADAAVTAFDLPKPQGVTMTFFVKLDLRDARGRTISDNFYWLSAKPDTLDWAHKQDTVYTPQAEFGDLTGLNSLPQIKLQASALLVQKPGATQGTAHVRVKNTSTSVAFQIRLRLANSKDDSDVVPVFWEDNYFSLLPGEERIVAVSYDASPLHGAPPKIQVGGFNIASEEVPAPSTAH
jgi:exo-1,4-beta-D-glucosaminidase